MTTPTISQVDARYVVNSPNNESAPLLADSSSPNFDLSHVPAWDPQALRKAHSQQGVSTGMLWVAEIGILIWFSVLWKVVLTHQAGLFTFHPLLQSFAILLFYQGDHFFALKADVFFQSLNHLLILSTRRVSIGILVLQPTKTASQKRSGLTVHEYFQIGGTLAIIAGTAVMILNKSLHQAPHFTSWHGLLGFITACLLVFQALFGGLMGFEWSRRLILGEGRARNLWKYHRASGYLITLLITLTTFTATKSDWLIMVSSTNELGILAILTIIALVGLLSRVDIHKIIPFRSL